MAGRNAACTQHRRDETRDREKKAKKTLHTLNDDPGRES